MIARKWHGIVPKSKSDDYLDYLKETGVAECLKGKGNNGVLVFRRDQDDLTHYLFISLWDTLDSIREFSGNNIEKARYFTEDEKYLLEFEPNVDHSEVFKFSQK